MKTFYDLTSRQRKVTRGTRQMWTQVVVFVMLLAVRSIQAQTLPAGFSQVLVADGLNAPNVVVFAPDGRIFVAEKNGILKVIKNGTVLATPFLQLPVSAEGERGLIGAALDPNFASNQYVYLYYTTADGSIHNRVSRFTANGDVAVPNSELVLLDMEPLGPTNHNGGGIVFGTDGKLYIGVGDNAIRSNPQNLDNHLGKVLRINSDGSIPADNPFPTGSDARRRIWAYGLRNPYTLAVQPGTGRLFVNDVGEQNWEEINDATAKGKNFGWPAAEGPSTDPAFTNPVYAYPHGAGDGSGCSITGGTFFNPATTNYPASFVGKYLYQEFCNNWINFIDISGATAARSPFATNLVGQGVGLTTGPDGNLYYMSLGAGLLLKIVYTAAPVNDAPVVANSINAQTARVGQVYSFTIPPNTFSDPNGDVLTLAVSGLPAGLNFVAPATISGTPSAAGVSTITLTATDAGGLSVNTQFALTTNPDSTTVPPGEFAITGVGQVNCAVVTASERSLTFTPQYSGLNGQAVSFRIQNETLPTTAPGPYTIRLYTDNPTITLKAQQAGTATEASFTYNWLAACNGSTTPNRPPVLANGIGAQSAQVGQSYSFTIPANTFSDPDGDALTLFVGGLPAGLSFVAPATISGIPSATGVSTITVIAVDAGSLVDTTQFNLTVNPTGTTVPPSEFAITGVGQVNCAVVTASERSLTFTPQYSGLNGQAVTFQVVNETLPTSAPGPYTIRLYTDNPAITLKAQQAGTATEASFTYNWLAACNAGGRIKTEVVSDLTVLVLGNPVMADMAEIEVRGAAGHPVRVQVVDGRGHTHAEAAIEKAGAVERAKVQLGRSAGMYLLRVSTPTQQRVVKVVKP